MSLVVTKGYLIGRYNYQLFDEILIFLNQYGNKFTCIALGTRKINSKNARALQLGNFLEIEFFYTNNDNKLSKLKKVTALNQLDFVHSSNIGLITASDILAIMKKLNKQLYDFYQDIIIKVLQSYDQYQVAVYSYLFFIKVILKKYSLIKCNHKHPITIGYSFGLGGFVCVECNLNVIAFLKDELLCCQEYFNQKNDSEFFSSKTYNINWKSFYLKLRSTFLELAKKINSSYKK